MHACLSARVGVREHLPSWRCIPRYVLSVCCSTCRRWMAACACCANFCARVVCASISLSSFLSPAHMHWWFANVCGLPPDQCEHMSGGVNGIGTDNTGYFSSCHPLAVVDTPLMYHASMCSLLCMTMHQAQCCFYACTSVPNANP